MIVIVAELWAEGFIVLAQDIKDSLVSLLSDCSRCDYNLLHSRPVRLK